MPIREIVDKAAFNANANLPFELRLADFEIAIQDVYDFFYDVNLLFDRKGLPRLDDNLRPAILSGMLSDMMTASMAAHSRSLVQNTRFNGHPDLLVVGQYPNNGIQSGLDGIEIKTTRKCGGAVDTHGAREQWMCVFVYETDNTTGPAQHRRALRFTEIYLAKVEIDEFRSNARGSSLGTRTATLHGRGILKLRDGWIYKLHSA